MNRRDVRIIEKSTAFRGYFRIDRYRVRHRLFGGGWSGEIAREVFERGHAAAALPYDALRDKVVLIEQFRMGAYAARRGPWLLEAIAGIIEAGESAEDVIRREAVEEAGCAVETLIPIGEVLVSPGGASQTTMIYCALVDSEGLGGIHGQADEHEDIKVHVMPFSRAWKLLGTGRVRDSTTMIALQWLALNRERLRRRRRGKRVVGTGGRGGGRKQGRTRHSGR